MVHFRDEGSVFLAPLELVWQFVGSGDRHSEAHGHSNTRRKLLSGNSGEYSWEQPFFGIARRFTMRWNSFYPIGLAYEVLEGPFAGSTFFLFYTPQEGRTGVTVVGEFVSPTLPTAEIPAAVDRFFATEFAQDHAAIQRLQAKIRDAPPGE